MRIFVSGSEGQLARCLQDVAGRLDDITLICKGRPDFDLTRAADIERQVVDLKPDIIINAAAYTAVDKAESEPTLAFAVNCEGAAAMARAAASLSVPILQLSTDYVFSGSKPLPYIETDDVGPATVYGQSKLAAELLVRNIAPRHLILRTAWVYSPYGNNFVRTMIRLARDKTLVRVVADQAGCPTSAADLAETAINLSRQLFGGMDVNGIFHVAGRGETTWAGFAQAIFSHLGHLGLAVPAVEPISTLEYPTPAKRPANSRLDCTKLLSVFGLEMPHWETSLIHSMEKTISP